MKTTLLSVRYGGIMSGGLRFDGLPQAAGDTANYQRGPVERGPPQLRLALDYSKVRAVVDPLNSIRLICSEPSDAAR